MSDQIFRKKSVERLRSPDHLDDYLRVTGPGVWLLLICVTLLLAGACVWAIYGRIDSVAAADVRVENGVAVCLPDGAHAAEITAGMTVRFAGTEGVVADADDAGAWAVQTDRMPPDGLYEGELVLESLRPFSFIVN